MKKLTICFLILLLALSCNTNKHIGAAAIGLVDLDNYILKDNVDLSSSLNYMIITNQSDFDNTFGIATSGAVNIICPEFKGQTVVACIAQSAAGAVHVLFEKAEMADRELDMYCTTTENHHELKETSSSVALATVPKVMNINRIVFFNNGEKTMVKTVDFKNENSIVNSTQTENIKPVVLKRIMRRPAII